MRAVLRYILHLSLLIWLGGIIFFSAIAAPAAFGILRAEANGSHLAGEIVRGSLGALHWMGLVCGAVFLLCSSALHRTFRRMQNYLIVLMMALTALSQFVITPKIEQLRASPAMMTTSEGLSRFSLLHRTSVMIEGGVLLLGLVVLALALRRTPE